MNRLYGVKMRASRASVHLSGAERIVDAQAVPATVYALARRVKVPYDFLNIKVEAVENPLRLKALPVVAHPVATPAEGWQVLERLLAQAGFTRVDEIRARFAETYSMRGAMLLDAETLERLEPDPARGVRATNMDSVPSPSAEKKDHFAEALTLATKVLAAPGIVGEICVSDDPGYVTGYVTVQGAYHRITVLKEKDSPLGGRIFLYRGRREDVAETIRFLERQSVIVESACAPAPQDRFAGLAETLRCLDAEGLTRTCRPRDAGKVSFADNDYLALAPDARVMAAAAEAAARYGAGAGASRLVTGTQAPHLALERHIAAFKGTEDAIVFSSGYMANLGAITALVGKGDIVFSDALNHASIVDACRLCGAEVVVYPHGDLDALERGLKQSRAYRRRLAVTDGVFSMDGDLVDLPRFLDICNRHDAFSMVDEAHALGVVGKTGHGLVEHFACAHADVMMGTLSKALGSCGGYIAGRKTLVEYLRQKARTFIFDTAPTAAAMAAADTALSILEAEPERVARLHANIGIFLDTLGDKALAQTCRTAIIPVIVGDERRALAISRRLADEGFLMPAIRYPSVARASARLRIAINAAHTPEQLRAAATALARALRIPAE